MLIFLYIKFVYFTSRKKYIYESKDLKKQLQNKQIIYAFWHGRLALGPYYRNEIKVNVVISEHADGKLIAEVMRIFNMNIVSGSSTKNAFAAYKGILQALNKGESVAITPDGPRGPAQKIEHSNIIKISQKNKIPILPVCFSAKKMKRLRSWDKFCMPMPFNKLYFYFGDLVKPYENESETSESNYQSYLEAKLNNICFKADNLCK